MWESFSRTHTLKYKQLLLQSVAIRFCETSIWPFNRNLFTDANFIKSENATEEIHQIHVVSVQQRIEEDLFQTKFQTQATENDRERAEIDKENLSPSLPSIPGPSTCQERIISPEEISPAPKIIRKGSTRSRKRIKSSILSVLSNIARS